MKKRVLTLALALAMTAALCLGGGQSVWAAENGSTGEAVDGGELTVGIAADLDSSLDPHVSSSSAGTREVLFNIFEGLVKPDTQGDLILAVAEDYTVNETADEYTFILREGVRFHNGQPVTVEDVVYSLSRAAGLETGVPLVDTLAGIASVEAKDDKTVVITLSAPNAEFLPFMTVAIIPAGNDPAQELIGTGPFRYVSRSPQENIVMEKFADYWGQPAHLDRVTFRVIDNAETLVMSLQSGAIDFAAKLEASQVAQLDGLTVLEGSMATIQALYLNNGVAPFDDVRVRQALCYAIDKHEVIDIAADGHGSAVGSSMYPAFGKYFDESLTDYYAHDVDKAVELLAEAGYTKSNPLEFSIVVPSNYTPHVDAAQVMVSQMEATGVIRPKIELVEWATWQSEAYGNRNFQATVCGMEAKTLTAAALLERFNSDNAKNFINFDCAEYDETYAAAASATDDAQKTALYRQCEAILTEQAANVYIQDIADFAAMKPDVKGYEFYPMYVMDFATVYRAE